MESRNFLILRLSAVGDVIRTIPAVKVLKEQCPSSHIAWMVEEPSKALLESQPEIDEVILFPRKRWTEGIKSPHKIWRTLREMWGFILDLRKQRFDVVLDFHGFLKSGLVSFLSGAPKRIGFDRRSSQEGNFLFSNVKVSLSNGKVSRFKRNFVLLKGIGLEIKPLLNGRGYPGFVREKPNLHIPPKDFKYIESFFLNTWSTPPKRPWIALHSGTSSKTVYKRWMSGRYSELADRLVHELGATTIFTWGPGELSWVEEIRTKMMGPSVIGPKTESLTQLGELFRRCDLYIGGDTGPMHIASLMGIPVVVIYGPTDPVVNEPFGPHKKIIKEVGCNPCRKRSCKELTCLKAVTADDVFKVVKEIMNVTD